MCGKDKYRKVAQPCRLGSPPHVRERLLSRRKLKEVIGITPACAGKTDLLAASRQAWEDHPRMCGKD